MVKPMVKIRSKRCSRWRWSRSLRLMRSTVDPDASGLACRRRPLREGWFGECVKATSAPPVPILHHGRRVSTVSRRRRPTYSPPQFDRRQARMAIRLIAGRGPSIGADHHPRTGCGVGEPGCDTAARIPNLQSCRGIILKGVLGFVEAPLPKRSARLSGFAGGSGFMPACIPSSPRGRSNASTRRTINPICAVHSEKSRLVRALH